MSRYAAGTTGAGEEEPLLGEGPPPKPKLKLPPQSSVYSAIIFLPAISRAATGNEWNRPARLAILLCFLNAMLQNGMVQVINVYNHSEKLANAQTLLRPEDIAERGHHIGADAQRQASERFGEHEENAHRAFLLPNEKKEFEAAKDIQPLCTRSADESGTFSCMPHSVRFVFEWDNLDSNGDGVWTLEEAKADKARLKDKERIHPETIFNNLINGLRMQAAFLGSSTNNSLYLSKAVEAERGIQKAYFNYWKGDAMMCSFFDSNSCEAVAKAGIFDAALRPGRISSAAKGIHDLDSAIQYCYRMLNAGRGCETLLPTDFKRNREQRWGRCGKRSLVEGGKYTNPFNANQSVHVLEATYATVGKYQRATSRLFLFFMSLIIMLWLLSLIDTYRELIKFGEFLFTFPGVPPNEKGGYFVTSPSSQDVTSPSSQAEESCKIIGISKLHRIVLAVVFWFRVVVAVVLTQFGTEFLLEETDYLSLVMNSLALTFILTIDQMLFELVEKDVTRVMDNSAPLEFETHLPTEGCFGYCLKKECWGLFLVPVLSFCIVIHYNMTMKEPILTVLRCACTQEGDKCLDSVQSQIEWWRAYWAKVLPGAMHQIQALRLVENSAAVPAL